MLIEIRWCSDKDDKFSDDPTEWADVNNDGVGDNNDLFGAISNKYPIVTIGNTVGFVGTTALVGLVWDFTTTLTLHIAVLL